MDVRLYWDGDFPEYLPPLLEALESLPETDDAPGGEVVFCPDATAFPVPDEPADGIVAAIPNTTPLYHSDGREAFASVLSGWAGRGAAAPAAAIVLSEPHPADGWTLREALATGVPVVTPHTSLVSDHLAAIGAGAYPYSGPQDIAGLAEALTAALKRDRGPELERSAREAVLGESWAKAAAALYSTLMASIAPAAEQAPEGRRAEAVSSERLSVCVLNPHPSGGGGERFMRELVSAMAQHETAPQIKLVCQIKPFESFDPGTDLLRSVGVDVVTVPGNDFDQVAMRELQGFDVVYCSWPHRADPPPTEAPLVCTFHDLNWKHFDVNSPQDKVQLEAQTPRWIELSSAMVHSSNFIRGEMQHFYGTPDSLSHVIPLTAETPAEPATPEERAG